MHIVRTFEIYIKKIYIIKDCSNSVEETAGYSEVLFQKHRPK